MQNKKQLTACSRRALHTGRDEAGGGEEPRIREGFLREPRTGGASSRLRFLLGPPIATTKRQSFYRFQPLGIKNF